MKYGKRHLRTHWVLLNLTITETRRFVKPPNGLRFSRAERSEASAASAGWAANYVSLPFTREGLIYCEISRLRLQVIIEQ